MGATCRLMKLPGGIVYISVDGPPFVLMCTWAAAGYVASEGTGPICGGRGLAS